MSCSIRIIEIREYLLFKADNDALQAENQKLHAEVSQSQLSMFTFYLVRLWNAERDETLLFKSLHVQFGQILQNKVANHVLLSMVLSFFDLFTCYMMIFKTFISVNFLN